MATPVADSTTPLSSTVNWVGWGFSAGTLVAFSILFAVAFFKKWTSRPRVYRTIFCGMMASFGMLGLTTLTVNGNLNQTVVLANGNSVVSIGWFFGLAVWTNFWVMLGFFSYVPATNDMGRAFHALDHSKSKSSEKVKAALSSIDFIATNDYGFTPAAGVMAILIAGSYMFFALQQSYVSTLWEVVAIGILGGVIVIIAGIVATVAVVRVNNEIVTKASLTEKNVNFRKSVTIRFLILFWIYLAVSIISYPFAFGFSPAFASDQPSYTADNAVILLYINIYVSTAALFVASLVLDIWVPKLQAEAQSRDGSKGE